MADLSTGAELSTLPHAGSGASLANTAADHPILNLTPDEKRAFQYLFQQADTENLGVVTGEVAVKFFERTGLAPAILGEIWQIADTENRGLLTSAGFCQVLRLIGHYQAGKEPSPELAFRRTDYPIQSCNAC
jgi:epidermal growth factor receptor substrate 15